jgi:signal transduction histidine kinase
LLARTQSICLKVAVVTTVAQALAAFALKENYAATVTGDVATLILTSVLVILCGTNSRSSTGPARMFWLLNLAAFVFLLFSYSYWSYYEVLLKKPASNPLIGDGFFFLMPALMLAALAFRPHSESAASDLRFRRIDFAFLLSWWLCLYCYFVVPWLTVVNSFTSYNRANYFLVLAEQSSVVLVLLVLWRRTAGPWRRFYGHACLGNTVFALANLVQGLALAAGKYYSGSIYDVPPSLGGLWVVYAFAIGSNLQPSPESVSADSDRQGLWTARLGMIAIVSLPVLAIYGYLEDSDPGVVITFRLRLILGAMSLLGALGFLRLYVLERELQRLVTLTESSYDSLKTVQERIALSQKLAALGRLASGAAHEINNPLTAIFGYSGLLADNPSLSPQERRLAHEIQQQVRLAQSAVSSMREPASISSADNPAQTPSSAPVRIME